MALLKSRVTFVLLVVALAATIFFVAKQTPGTAGGDGQASEDHSGHVHDEGVSVAHAASPFEVKDERLLVGSAENVFVGRVVKQVGSKGFLTKSPDFSLPPEEREGREVNIEQPRTQFAVRVEENIKGSLSGQVVVSQMGGRVEYNADADYPEKNIKKGERVRELILVDEDPLLEPGQEYVFTTDHVPGEGWYQIVTAGYGDVKIKDAKDRKEKVDKFKKAKEEQKDPSQAR